MRKMYFCGIVTGLGHLTRFLSELRMTMIKKASLPFIPGGGIEACT